MTKCSFKEVINLVLSHEGGYVNDPDDPGGETKYGISKRAYPNVDIKDLTKEDAKKIYYRDYWLKSHCDKLPENIRYVHFDTAVNMGTHKAAKLLQESVGAAQDGKIGPKTMAAVNSRASIRNYVVYRLKSYVTIILRRPSSIKYIKGWFGRVIDIVLTT